MNYDTAIPIGGSEAAEVVDRIQNAEANEDPAQSRSAPAVSDAAANRGIAEAWGFLMDLRAMQGEEYEHWKADAEEKKAIRDHVAPSVRQVVPNSVLANSKHGIAIGTVAKILLSKKAQDPE